MPSSLFKEEVQIGCINRKLHTAAPRIWRNIVGTCTVCSTTKASRSDKTITSYRANVLAASQSGLALGSEMLPTSHAITTHLSTQLHDRSIRNHIKYGHGYRPRNRCSNGLWLLRWRVEKAEIRSRRRVHQRIAKTPASRLQSECCSCGRGPEPETSCRIKRTW